MKQWTHICFCGQFKMLAICPLLDRGSDTQGYLWDIQTYYLSICEWYDAQCSVHHSTEIYKVPNLSEDPTTIPG